MMVSMERWIGSVAIVTGASSGIGAAISEYLVKEGLKVAALARRADRLEEMARKLSNFKGELFPVPTDIAKEEEILKAIDWIEKNLGPISILVNNAGVGRHSSILDSTTEMYNEIFQVNVIGLCVLTREAVKSMRENNINGHIININSVLGHYYYNIPMGNVYPASKHAVTTLTESLRVELASLNTKIRITSISPGLVETEILGDYSRALPLKELLENENILKPEDIADAVVYILSTPPRVQVHELMIRANGDIIGK